MKIDIENFIGLYIADDSGFIESVHRSVVYSNGRIHIHPGKVLTSDINHSGYHRVTLFKNGKRYRRAVHRIIAKAFIPNPKRKPQINHKDGNPSNNSVTNLEWCTGSENNKHAYDKLGRKANKTGLGKTGSKSARSVPVICLNTGEVFVSVKEAAIKINASRSGVSAVCNGVLKTIKGLKFKMV